MFFKRVGQSKAPQRAVFLALSVVVPSLFLSACMSSEKDIDLSTYVDQTEPADVLYNQGLANLNAGRLEEASKKFDAVDRQHPAGTLIVLRRRPCVALCAPPRQFRAT